MVISSQPIIILLWTVPPSKLGLAATQLPAMVLGSLASWVSESRVVEPFLLVWTTADVVLALVDTAADTPLFGVASGLQQPVAALS